MQMELFERILKKKDYIAVVGLGYVGLPVAAAFAEKVKTLGFDINEEKVNVYKSGIDPTHEIGDEKIQNTTLEFTHDPARLREASVIIVAVPTPVNGDKTPNLAPVIDASKLIGQNLKKGSIVVFESTVYPGVTEEVCIPILEKESKLVCGSDFKVGYSPERINPGDKVHKLENIKKIVAGMDTETTEIIAAIYELIIQAGVYKAPSIKVAEAAKLAENAQRDINIAFMNELSMAFDRMNISTKAVIDAMNTKWNALGFYPGLVGGHCIGVDPYYFIYQAEILGYHSQIIAAGRKINDSMSVFVADNIIKK
jgi:UDP-N-acetyl-D-galactosamine dehydrogenase